jgi:hypothetical protein
LKHEQGETMRRIRNGSIFLLIAMFACGCGRDGRIRAQGQLIKNGAPFKLGEAEGMRIVFVPVDAGESTFDTYVAVFAADGSFTVTGKDGKGLPPGKYRVTVEHLKKKEDLFQGAFSGKNTPIVREVTNSSNKIIIDLDNPRS